jgi:MFS family permease
MERHYGWVVVGAGAVVTCVAMGAMFALPVCLAPIAEETGWSRAGISGAMTIAFIVMGVAGFGWGVLSDRIGARPVVLTASMLLGAGLFLASRATDLIVFQLAYGGMVGAAGGAFFAPIMAATVGWFDKHRSLAVSLVSIGGGIAPMIGTPFATILIEAYGWRTSMLAIAIGALVLLLVAGLFIRRPPLTDEKPAAMDSVSLAGSKGRSPAFAALRTPQFIVLAATFFFCCAAHSGPIFHTVSYAMICGASALAAASLYSIEGVAGLFGRLVFGVAADRLGVRRVLLAGLALQAIGIYSYIYVSDLPQFYLLAVVLGLAYGGVMPLYAVLARDYFSPQVMGTVLGAATMAASFGMSVGPIAGGWLYDSFGSYNWLYISSAGLGLAAVAMSFAFPPPAKQDGEHHTGGQLQPV